MLKLHETKPEELLKMTPDVIQMRAKRAAIQAQNEAEFLKSQALASKQFRAKKKADESKSVDSLAESVGSVAPDVEKVIAQAVEAIDDIVEAQSSAGSLYPSSPTPLPRDDSPVSLTKTQKKNRRRREAMRKLKQSLT